MFQRRDDYVLATKVFYPMGPGPNDRGLSRKHIVSAIDTSLRRLGTDYVDLYQIHRFDVDTPVEETIQALDDLIPLCADMGVGLIPHSPLARGLLAGTRRRSGVTGTKRAAVSGGDRWRGSKAPTCRGCSATFSAWSATWARRSQVRAPAMSYGDHREMPGQRRRRHWRLACTSMLVTPPGC